MLEASAGRVDRVADARQLLKRSLPPVLLQPQSLAEHFLHGVADRIGVVSRDGFDFRARLAEPGLERIGGIEQFGDRALAGAGAASADQNGRAGGQRGQQQQDDGEFHAQVPRGSDGSLPRSRRGRQMPWQVKGLGLTSGGAGPSISRLMSAEIPEIVDAWRWVAARRRIEGRVPLASLPRLRDGLFEPEGDVRFTIEFDRDALQLPSVVLEAEAELPLQCQRSLQRFLLPVRVEQRLGLIRDEADEAALPEGYEPLLVPADGHLRPLDLVEDELILALPVVPVGPGMDPLKGDWSQDEDAPRPDHPFAALSALKKPAG